MITLCESHQIAGSQILFSNQLKESAALNVLYKVLSLDASDQYFDVIENILCFIVPSNLTTRLIDEIKASYAARIRNTINDGIEVDH